MLTDFGLAKEIDESSRSNSMCGTTEYMAPEILLSKGHNKYADWWSVGILLYEMLTGQANRKKLLEKIIKWKVKLPSYLSTKAHSLLKGVSVKFRKFFPLHLLIFFFSYCKRNHLKGWVVVRVEVMRSKVINGFNQSTGRN